MVVASETEAQMAEDESTNITRRNLLTKSGLAAGAAYFAPTFAGLDVARASGASGRRFSAPSRSGGWGRGSGPSRPSRPSGPSRPRSSQSRAVEHLYRRLFGLGNGW